MVFLFENLTRVPYSGHTFDTLSVDTQQHLDLGFDREYCAQLNYDNTAPPHLIDGVSYSS